MDEQLINDSIFILRETLAEFKNPAILWSTGKDSTASLGLCKESFLGKIPFPVIHIDTGYKFLQMYEFRDALVEEWKLDLIIAQNKEERKRGLSPKDGKLECCTKLKTEALLQCLKKHKFDALILSIRRDEHGIRGKERVFSPRQSDFTWSYQDQPLEVWDIYQNLTKAKGHTRVHPILHWTELEVWEYMQLRKLPVNPMYFAKNGMRYRSLGCEPCTAPMESNADTIDKIVEELRTTKVAERSGRAQDKESSFAMQKLRMLGYM